MFKFKLKLKLILSLSLIFTSFAGISQDCFFCFPTLWNFNKSDWPIEFTKVEKYDYPRNQEASFCKRPEEMIDTIVIHHTKTSSQDDPERINDYHLSRGTPDDPWLMIGYTYTINSPYPGQKFPAMKVSEGRPIDIVGSHAGSDAFVTMTKEQQKLWKKGKITCGKEGGKFEVNPNLVRDGKIKANVTTIGLAVIGNYSPFSFSNPLGFNESSPRYPTPQTRDLVARMACQLQKKYPRIKYIKWHSFYRPTQCPGTLRDYIESIKNMARSYGCAFY